MIWLFLLFWLVVLWAITRFYLAGEDLSRYDRVSLAARMSDAPPSDGHHQAVAAVREMLAGSGGLSGGGSRAGLERAREAMDAMGDRVSLDGFELRPADAAGVPGEWVLAAGADPRRRLLYLHGGAFMLGSPRSHRPITTELARRTGAAVLAIDYRLMPEHRRLDCLSDCQTAYRYLLEEGPDGPAPLDALLVAGDSAGGNLTLAVLAWARDEGLRPADAAVAFSPATDATLASPSLFDNIETDHMLGPAFGRAVKAPRALMLWFTWFSNRLRPADPRLSPLRGDLDGLPPLLVQVSEAEMLYHDAHRYVARAREQGSPARLQSWPHMLHVWQIFDMPEARAALDEVETFLRAHLSTDAAQPRAAAGG